MKIYQRYIFTKFFYSFLFSYIFFVFFYISGDSLTNIDEIIRHKIAFLKLVEYYFTNLISLSILIFIPLSSLVASAFALTELNRTSELLALRSFGISNYKIILPLIIFLLLLSLFSLYLCEYWLPDSLKRHRNLKSELFSEKIKKREKVKNIVNFTDEGQVIVIGEFLPKKNLAKEIVIFNQREFEKIYAHQGIYKNKKWMLKEVTLHRFFSSQNPISFYKELKLNLPSPKRLITESHSFDLLPTKVLKERINYFKKIKAYEIVKNLETELNKKYIICLLPFFLNITFLGVFLKIKKNTSLLSNLGVGVLCSFVFYVALSASIALGKSGFLNPFLSCWLVPFIGTLWGVLNFLSLN